MKFILKRALNEGIYIVLVGKHAIPLSKQLLKRRQRQQYQHQHTELPKLSGIVR